MKALFDLVGLFSYWMHFTNLEQNPQHPLQPPKSIHHDSENIFFLHSTAQSGRNCHCKQDRTSLGIYACSLSTPADVT